MNKKEIKLFIKSYRFSQKDMLEFGKFCKNWDASSDMFQPWMVITGRLTQEKLDIAKYHREQLEAGNCA